MLTRGKEGVGRIVPHSFPFLLSIPNSSNANEGKEKKGGERKARRPEKRGPTRAKERRRERKTNAERHSQEKENRTSMGVYPHSPTCPLRKRKETRGQ